MVANDHTRRYERDASIVFLKTKEVFGGLSNMAAGFPLCVNDVQIRTSEALYQACRFPHLPQVQAEIIAQKSPMTAKMKSKPHRKKTRSDWEKVRVKIMRWCLRVKLAQNWDVFGSLLLETGDRPIVEQSTKDIFWGAKPVNDHTLVGMNVLGRLLMELRELVKIEPAESLQHVKPLDIPEFLLQDEQIRVVEPSNLTIEGYSPTIVVTEDGQTQGSLFDDHEMEQAPRIDKMRTKSSQAGQTVIKPYPAMQKIILPDEDAEIEPVPPGDGGHRPEPELDRLSNILKVFNDHFGNIPWEDADRVRQLITQTIPARVAADTAYKNAQKNSDKQNARIEHDDALLRVMTSVMKDDTELFKQFMDNEGFKRWMADTVFGLTYDAPSR